MSSNTPQPGDSIRITGTFDINVDLPPDIKIFVKSVENVPEAIEGFTILGSDSTIPVDLSSQDYIEVNAQVSSAPEDTIISWTTDSPDAVVESEDGLGYARISLTDNPGFFDPETITLTATASSPSTGQVISETVDIEKKNSIGTIGQLTPTITNGNGDEVTGTTYTAVNGEAVFINVANDPGNDADGNPIIAATPSLLDWKWEISSLNPILNGDEIPADSGVFYNNTPLQGFAFTGADDDTEVLLKISAESPSARDGVQTTEVLFTVGNPGSAIEEIGSVAVVVTDSNGDEVTDLKLDNFTTYSYAASFDGNASTGIDYSWTSSDPQALITDNQDGTADIQFQAIDDTYSVTCVVTGDEAVDSGAQTTIDLTVGNPGGYVPVEGEFIEPGSGWTGLLATPSPQGDPNHVAYEFEAVARWPTRNYMSYTQSDGIITFCVVAAHHSGIAYVDFFLNGGTPVRVTETSYIPEFQGDTDTKDLYAISVDTANLPLGDYSDSTEDYELRAIAMPNSGHPRVLQGPPDHIAPEDLEGGAVAYPEGTGLLHQSDAVRGLYGMFFNVIDPAVRKVYYVDNINGQDTTNNDGSFEKPWKTLDYASWEGVSGFDNNGDVIRGQSVSDTTLYLMPSPTPYYKTGYVWPRTSLKSYKSYFTVASFDPDNPATLVKPSIDLQGTTVGPFKGGWGENVTKLRLQNLHFQYDGNGEKDVVILGAAQNNILVENCTFNSEFTLSNPIDGFNRWSGFYNCFANRVKYGPFGKGVNVRCAIDQLHVDAYRSGCGFLNSCTNASRLEEEFNGTDHQDMWQTYYKDGCMDNYIMHGFDATQKIATQGILLSGESQLFKNYYIKNSKIDTRYSDNGVPYDLPLPGGLLNNYYVYTDTLHFVIEDCEFSGGYITSAAEYPEGVPGLIEPVDGWQVPGNGYYTGRATRVHNVNYMGGAEPWFPYPDRRGGNGKGDFYKLTNGVFPWISPSTLYTYSSDTWQDYLLEVRLTEGSITVPDTNEVAAPLNKTFTANPVSDQTNFTYSWVVTANDGVLDDVVTTTGTSKDFNLQVTAGNTDRVYTVTCSVTAPDLPAADQGPVSSSFTFNVRPPVAFPVTFQGQIIDDTGNWYRLRREALQETDTWEGSDGKNVMPSAWLLLALRSFKRGLTFSFTTLEELQNRFLGEYAGKMMTLKFRDVGENDTEHSLTMPITLGEEGDQNANCYLIEEDDGSVSLQFPNGQFDQYAWDSFPGTLSGQSPEPFMIKFTTP